MFMKKTCRSAFFSLALAVLCASNTHAIDTLYKFTQLDGTTRYSLSLPDGTENWTSVEVNDKTVNLDAEYANPALREQRLTLLIAKLNKLAIEAPSAARASRNAAEANTANNSGSAPRAANPNAATAEPPAQFFYATWCGYCKRARKFLDARNVAYTAIDIDTPDGARQWNRVTRNGGNGVPILVVRGVPVNGFDRERYEQLFPKVGS
jgi:glutaredoxin